MSTIDPTIRTSRVFDATLAVFDAIAAATMPAHPTLTLADESPFRPSVFLFRDPGWEASEYVVVVTNDDPAVNEWIQSGPAAREERIVVDAVIRTMYPETDDEDPNVAVRRVIARLEAIADVVQAPAYDVATGRPKAIGFSNEHITGRVVSVTFRCAHTSEGVVGEATVQFALVAQI